MILSTIVVLFLQWIIAILYSGFALFLLWGWFVAPLGVIQISIPWAIGLCCIVSIVKGHNFKPTPDENLSPLAYMIWLFIGNTGILVVGYVCHRFM